MTARELLDSVNGLCSASNRAINAYAVYSHHLQKTNSMLRMILSENNLMHKIPEEAYHTRPVERWEQQSKRTETRMRERMSKMVDDIESFLVSEIIDKEDK